MPGISAGLYGVTTRYTGFSTGVPSSGDAAAICRNNLLSTDESLYPDRPWVKLPLCQLPCCCFRVTAMIDSSKQRGARTMPNSLWNRLTSRGLSRRALFQRGGVLAAAHALGTGLEQTASADPMQPGNIYRSIGVRPVINARGTFTIITGSTTLPEVKSAMEEASRSFVNMDELMEGVGKRLAELSG